MSSEAGEGSSTSASPKKEQMEAQAKAVNLLAQGKRNLICQEVPIAVQQFQDACELLVGAFGEMAKECAEAYFHYGSALLDLSRMEQGVLGNALEGVDVDADDEGGPNNTDQFESTDKIDDVPEKKKDMEAEEEGEEEEEEEEEEEAEGEEEAEKEGEEEDKEDADDVSNLQLSWEMLDLAKMIYSKDPSKESQLRAAEAHLKLGEVSLESEQYEQAIEDLESCLKIQLQHLDSCDRSVAETYYQLGLARQMTKELDKARDCFNSAVKCLETKIEQLSIIVKEKPPKSPSQFVEPAEKAQKEIDDIMDILPEIKNKITDTIEEGKELEELKNMTKQAMGSVFGTIADSTTETTGFAATSSTSPSKSTDPPKNMDISHLVRKKRKPEEEEKQESAEDLEKKKQKQSGCGDAGINGIHEQTNSTTESEAVAAT